MKRYLLFVAMLPLLAHAQNVALPAGVVKPAFFDKQGIKLLSYQKGASGLNVWRVERGAVRTVFYSTPDNKLLMSGVLWDATTGANISDAYITPDMVVPATQAGASIKQFSSGKVSDALKGVSVLAGIKEGNASIDKTLYIIFDPRCPHCHAVYEKTRKFVKSGGTIKWLPTTALGDASNGARFIADIMQARNPIDGLSATMGKRGSGSTTPNASTLKVIAENEAYFFAAFDRNKGVGVPGVPVAFFETQNGAPQMVAGIDDDILLNRIFTDIKK